ncbi:MAG: glycosyltransferase family 4 protein, partial [Candidatus Nanopelagicales bacterium]
GGAEEYTRAVTSRLAGAGHEVHLCSAAVTGAPTDEVLDGVTVRRRGGPLVGAYRDARLHYERTQAERPWDLIVDEVNTRPFSAPLWTRSTPVLALCYQLTREVWRAEAPLPLAVAGRWVLEPWWWTRYRRTTVATISPSSAESLRDQGIADVRVLPVGGEFAPRPDVARTPTPTVVSVGRVSAMKRPFDVLAAHSLLLRTRPDARLWFLGDGPDIDALRRAASGVRGVEVLGRVSEAEKRERMASAWALASTSLREGWGLVVSEAAAMGTHTVGYRVPGLVDSIAATGGVLCDGTPSALADALDTDLDRLAATRPTSTGTTTWDEVAAAFEQLAVEVADRAHARPGRADRPVLA